MTVLVYLRRNAAFDKTVVRFANENFAEHAIFSVSEYRGRDMYINVNDESHDTRVDVINFISDHLKLEEIIFRDRVLRNIPFSDSLSLIKRVVGNLMDLFKENEFSAVVGYPIDNYVTDILASFVEKQSSIEYFGVCNFFIDGYKRVTVYGEHKIMRDPSAAEAERVLSKLKSRFRSSMVPSRKAALGWALFRYLKYKLRYFAFYLFGYKLLGRLEYDLLATPYNATVRSIKNFFLLGLFTRIEDISFSTKSVLLPLHYFPEATLEYWSGDLTCVEFSHVLLPRIRELTDRYDQVIVKEHPAMLFNNNRQFYKQIRDIPGVVLIDPFALTSELLSNVEAVGCWTGSSGIEGLVGGKLLEFYSDNYYCSAQEDLLVNNGKGVFLPDENATSFVRAILSGTVVWDE